MSGETATFSDTGETTGRFLVLFHRDAVEAGVAELSDRASVEVVSAAEGSVDALEQPNAGGGGVLFERLGVAVVDVPPDQTHALAAAAESDAVAVVEPERVVYAVAEEPEAVPPSGDRPVLSREYLRGFGDAWAALSAAAGLGDARPTAEAASVTTPPLVDGDLTWGLQATNVAAAQATGRGVRLAVLDTGFDLAHPDFKGRQVVTQSFVPGEDVQDGHGHGTHCIGTACGPRKPRKRPGYGIASEAEIFVGKVLNNRGRGVDQNILAGLEWALSNNCRIVSMSLGSRTLPGMPFSEVFERVARRALDQGTALIAAAGNDSNRASGVVAPIRHPANCPSIMAVAAIDSSFAVANFSNQGTDGGSGGEIDYAAPGVDIHSSWPMPLRYRTISGTSMATPHVAGIAALFAEINSNASAEELLGLVKGAVRQLPLPALDVGTGLVQALADGDQGGARSGASTGRARSTSRARRSSSNRG
jgi:subtilisin family serine protease